MLKNIIEHNPIERKIKSDLIKKNTIRKKLEQDLSIIKKWVEKLDKIKNNQRINRYLESIIRYSKKIKKNKIILNKLLLDLEHRIKTELKYSKAEVEELQELYRKEYDEMVDSLLLMIRAEKGQLSNKEKSNITGVAIENFAEKYKEKNKNTYPKEFILAKIKNHFKKDTKNVNAVEKEIISEEKDKNLFKIELRRIFLEKEVLK